MASAPPTYTTSKTTFLNDEDFSLSLYSYPRILLFQRRPPPATEFSSRDLASANDSLSGGQSLAPMISITAVLPRPGSMFSLTLRIVQCVLAFCSLVAMNSAPQFLGYTDFRGHIGGMSLLVLWSAALASFDVYVIKYQRDPPSRDTLTLFLIGDWLVGCLALGVAAVSSGLITYLGGDKTLCCYAPRQCNRAVISVIFAFAAWLTISVSALAMFWIRFSLP